MSVAVVERGLDLDRALLDMLGALVERAPLFADLRARGEAEDLVQEAMIAVGRRMERGGVEDPFAYATRVVQNLARRAYVRRRPEEPLPEPDLAALGGWGDVAGEVEQRFALAEVLDMVRGVTAVVRDLPADDLEIVRAELRRDDQRALAGRLGLSRATFYRRKQRAVSGFVAAVAGRAGAQPCAGRAEALLAAAGGSGFAAAVDARVHADGCPACATTLRHLTAARHGLALLAPFPALGVAADDAGERAATALHGVTDWLRGLAVRAPDPVAMLPGSKAVAAVAAACIGVGGGAYCALDGVPGAARDVHAAPQPRVAQRAPAAPAARATPSAATRAAAAPAPRRIPAAGAQRRAQRGEFRPDEGAEREFATHDAPARARASRTHRVPAGEFGAPVRSSRTATAAVVSRPRNAAAPATGGEFGASTAGGSSAGEFGG